MRSLINKVNVNDARFAKLIGDVQQGIADYYTRQMPKILPRSTHSSPVRSTRMRWRRWP